VHLVTHQFDLAHSLCFNDGSQIGAPLDFDHARST
jgi:hypothetical protein